MVKRTRRKSFGGQEMAQKSRHSPLCDNQRLVIVQDYCLVALPTKTPTSFCFGNCVAVVAFEYASFRGSLSEVVLFTVVHRVRMGSGEGAGSAGYSKEYGSNSARA